MSCSSRRVETSIRSSTSCCPGRSLVISSATMRTASRCSLCQVGYGQQRRSRVTVISDIAVRGAEMARSSVLGAATRVEPTSDDRDRAAEISRAGATLSQAVLRLPGGEEIALSESLVAVLIASAGQLSQGHGVTVLATEVFLTPAEVGELLGLSRPFVARLLDAGKIPSEHLPDSRHRVVRLVDVLQFQTHRERRRAGRRRIADTVQAADLPY